MGIRPSKGFYRLLFLGWSVLIVWLYFMPGKDLPQNDWFHRIHADKLVHAFIFLIEGILLLKMVGYALRWRIAGICTIAFVSVLLEIIQPHIAPGRLSEPEDAIANLTGVFLALFFWIVYSKYRFEAEQ